MNTPKAVSANPYLSGSVPAVFFKTAFPIILIMLVNGLYTVIDALYLGIYAGADALTAVTLTFPLFMLLVAVSTMVGAGMASILGRLLGAGEGTEARAVFQSAHGLALAICVIIAIVFTIFGHAAINAAAGNDPSLAAMGWSYIAILVYASPLMLFLSIQGDEMRSEGRVGTIALIGVTATVLNMIFNYIFIAVMELGPAGSAIGTICAQAVALAVVIWLRLSGRTTIGLSVPKPGAFTYRWREMITLGLPPSLSFAGIAINSSIVIAMVRVWGSDGYADTIAAYGILTRIMTFGFLPMMALNLACQSMAGNNYGAKAFDRSDRTLQTAVMSVIVYAVLFEAIMIAIPGPIGRLFVDNAAVVNEIARIMPIALLTYALAAPLVVLSGYYQSLGIAWAAGALSLAKPYLIAIPLYLALPFFLGETGIWVTIPMGDILMLGVAAIILRQIARRRGARLGMFFGGQTEPQAA